MPALSRSLIANLPTFQGLSAADLDFILSGARSSRYAKDAEIFAQQEQARHFYLLLSGHIRVVRSSPEGHHVIARYISEGELFGIAVAMGQTTYPASAVAAVDCVVLAWPNSVWPEFQSRFPRFSANMFQTVGSRLNQAQSQIMEIATEQVEQRIAHAILRLAKQAGKESPEGIEIDFPITRQDIAEMTGTTLHTVSRCFSAWESKGLVRGGRQRVTIVDPKGLTQIADQSRDAS